MKNNNTEKSKSNTTANQASSELASPVNELASGEVARLRKEPEQLIDAALGLMASQLLQALSTFDWKKWLRRHSAPTTKNLKAFMDVLEPLSRADLKARKFLADLEAAQKRKLKRPSHNHDLFTW